MKKEETKKIKEQPTRKLSYKRVLIAILIIVGCAYFVFINWKDIQENRLNVNSDPWFAPYVDVTATPQYEFEKLGSTTVNNMILSFIVSSSADACIPTWGNAYTLDKAGEALDLDRRIARLRQLGGDIAISFGGLLNNELALNCTDPDKLTSAYESVINKYNVNTLDFDLEGETLKNIEASNRRAKVIAALQEKYISEGKSLAIWLTLPVATFGLTEEGTNAVASMLNNGVDLAGVNVMTMNYGQSRVEGQSMEQATERALIETHRQLGILYSQAGIRLNSNSLWKKVGATPMIGQNDLLNDVFTLEDAIALNKFASAKGMIRLSMWSANRDIQCGENYANLTVVSDSCSGIKQQPLDFASELGKSFEGSILKSMTVTKEDVLTETELTDDPENSPYKIWNENHVYLSGTKVVWHRNVYQAKWWTQGDLPDNPILQAWQTPWELIGPVLPGEKTIEQQTLPEGTLPNWSGTQQYDAGEQIMFNGVPYQAKWWTQGDSPAAAASNPTSSPWIALSQSQINELLENN